MKKANVNLFDKNKVQVKLLKNKNLRISDGRKHPTKIVNLRKTGITIWTDGKHLKMFRGNRLTEIIGRSVYRVNKFQTVEFVAAGIDMLERRTINQGSTNSFVGVTNISEGLTIGSTTNSFVGVTNISEGLVGGNGTTDFVGVTNISEGRLAVSEDVLIIGARDASEARSLKKGYAMYISINDKSVIVRQGCM